MKKILKPLAIVFVSLILFYGIFVGVDCVRLSHAYKTDSPLVTVKTTLDGDVLKYTGVGYTVSYRLATQEIANYQEELESQNVIESPIVGAEFRLFDKILLWAWIE